MILTEEVEQELNTRNYYLEESPVSPPISPIIVLPPLNPVDGEGFVDRFGKLIVIGLIGMFFLAIYPENQNGGA